MSKHFLASEDLNLIVGRLFLHNNGGKKQAFRTVLSPFPLQQNSRHTRLRGRGKGEGEGRMGEGRRGKGKGPEGEGHYNQLVALHTHTTLYTSHLYLNIVRMWTTLDTLSQSSQAILSISGTILSSVL